MDDDGISGGGLCTYRASREENIYTMLERGELLLHPGFMAFDDDARLLAWHKKHWPTGKKQTKLTLFLKISTYNKRRIRKRDE